MKSYKITVGGEIISIKSDRDAAAVDAIEKELQNRYAALNTGRGPRDATHGMRVMAMVAIVLLDELATLKKKHEKTGDDALAFARDMSTRIDNILAQGPPDPAIQSPFKKGYR